MYETLLNDLDICSTKETCTGCSVEGEDKVPECYQLVMARAAETIRKLLEEREDMIPKGEYLSELMQQIRSTVADKDAYIAGLNAALYIAMAIQVRSDGEGNEQNKEE